jgi:hypothetical protein
MLNLKRHHRSRGIGMEIFIAPICLLSLMLWSLWMLIAQVCGEEVASGAMQQP